MPHVNHTLSKHVIENSNDYPAVVVNRAKFIFDWFEQKRKITKQMWQKRHIFHAWMEYMQLKPTHRRDRRMTASLMMQQNFYGDDLKLHYAFQGNFRRTEIKIGLDMLQFRGAILAAEHTDYARMLTYAEAVNSATFLGEEYRDMAFMRWVDRNTFIEILLWKLKEKS